MIFSHFDYFDELLDAALGAGEASWNHHERVSYVRIKVCDSIGYVHISEYKSVYLRVGRQKTRASLVLLSLVTVTDKL